MSRMNTRARVGLVLFLVLGLSGVAVAATATRAAAAVAPANDLYMFCQTGGGTVVYFSDIFVSPKPTGGPRGRQGNQIGQVFLGYLKTKYSLGADYHATCGGLSSGALKDQQRYKQQAEDLAKGQHKQVVETDWKYAP
jgi:hypothetical protein